MNIHHLGYMLQADANKRPNIWQVCQVAFAMKAVPNPVPNVFVSHFNLQIFP